MATRYVQDVSEQTDRVIEHSRQYVIQGNSWIWFSLMVLAEKNYKDGHLGRTWPMYHHNAEAGPSSVRACRNQPLVFINVIEPHQYHEVVPLIGITLFFSGPTPAWQAQAHLIVPVFLHPLGPCALVAAGVKVLVPF
jgi:hypothetical protein